MFVVGESVYKDCEQQVGINGVLLSCPFQGAEIPPRAAWCRNCLLAKIRSLEMALMSIAIKAKTEAEDKY